jgi:hypothetical protein
MELPLLLSVTTLGLVAVFAYVNARVTAKQLREKTFKRSTLCASSDQWQRAADQAAQAT